MELKHELGKMRMLLQNMRQRGRKTGLPLTKYLET